ncbi:lipopolysaccharide heptosyltransferase II [Helicobacter turcicus]|uniref:lipopolysaccharide heptosyltransferase II n=1 Tax=Helicobacter turcicus TaxID=2867412 RepID=A0ABS7JMQ5_9HELI|nr:lipopolysaccharide heptosyltransferase II [Helicobacter turcicus]MBX7490654.1 lipopolysaccharide heptosyltransferase II [Helicobacter turcicus]MBX7545438.1 lipopolysaccharide heptosyltransferase II [Helicobacter turcicus]
MNILIRLPNWLGDALMATYGLEILFVNFKNAHFFLVGSQVSIALFAHYPNVTILEDTSKKGKFRILNLYKLAKKIPPCDLALTFQNNFLSALFLAFNGAKLRAGFAKELRSFLLHHHPKKPKNAHEAMRFALLTTSTLELLKNPTEIIAIPKKLYLKPQPINITLPSNFKNSKIAGINAGAAFGAAKRWEESYFAKCIEYLLEQNYKILLFGVESESPINATILEHLPTKFQHNNAILNLSGKTNIPSLIAYFLHLDLLLTNDSGPMHIASALGIPTLALFGPTNAQETAPFCAKNAQIISLETLGKKLSCMPCMQRTCPLLKDSKDYHKCMRALTPNLVIKAIQSLIS